MYVFCGPVVGKLWASCTSCTAFARCGTSAHSAHVSWPHRELHRRPQWPSSHASPRPPHVHFGTPRTRFVAPSGAPPKAPMAKFTCVSAHTACLFRHTPRTFRGPIGSSTEGPNGQIHMRLLATTRLNRPSGGGGNGRPRAATWRQRGGNERQRPNNAPRRCLRRRRVVGRHGYGKDTGRAQSGGGGGCNGGVRRDDARLPTSRAAPSRKIRTTCTTGPQLAHKIRTTGTTDQKEIFLILNYSFFTSCTSCTYFAGQLWASCGQVVPVVRHLPDAALRHTPHTFRGPIGSSTEGPNGQVHMRLRAHRMSISAHPAHVSWPHRELHRRPQWPSSHASPRTPHVYFGTPRARFVAP